MELRPLLRRPPQKQAGLSYVGVHVTNGHIAAEDLKAFAALAKRYGQGRLRTTNSQNLVLLDIPERAVDALLQEAIFRAYPLSLRATLPRARATPTAISRRSR